MKRVLGALSCALLVVSCGVDNQNESDIQSQITKDGINIPLKKVSEFSGIGTLQSRTPTGEKIFEAILTWQEGQWTHRSSIEAKRVFATPEARMCAGNLSQVLYMTNIPSLKKYRWTAVDEVITAVDQVATVYRFPKNKSGVISTLEKIYNGKIPVGSVVGGCLEVDSRGVCKRIDGSRHVGLIGDTRIETKNGKSYETIMAYHNNWYRPDNASGQWHPHMVSQRNLKAGFPRQWMATPWLTLVRDIQTGKIEDAYTALINPVTRDVAIDDMDPFTYHTFIGVLPEIQAELSGTPAAPTLKVGALCKIIPTNNGTYSNIRSSNSVDENNILTTLDKGHEIKIRGFLDDKSGKSTKWASIEFSKDGAAFGAPARPSFIALTQIGECL